MGDGKGWKWGIGSFYILYVFYGLDRFSELGFGVGVYLVYKIIKVDGLLEFYYFEEVLYCIVL